MYVCMTIGLSVYMYVWLWVYVYLCMYVLLYVYPVSLLGTFNDFEVRMHGFAYVYRRLKYIYEHVMIFK